MPYFRNQFYPYSVFFFWKKQLVPGIRYYGYCRWNASKLLSRQQVGNQRTTPPQIIQGSSIILSSDSQRFFLRFWTLHCNQNVILFEAKECSTGSFAKHKRHHFDRLLCFGQRRSLPLPERTQRRRNPLISMWISPLDIYQWSSINRSRSFAIWQHIVTSLNSSTK